MSSQVNVQQLAVLSREEMQAQLVRHLKQQPESKQASHNLMKRLETASLILPLAAVVVAIVVIARSASLPSGAIPAALFAIPATLAPYLFLMGVHVVTIQAFPPVEYLLREQTRTQGFFTGSAAVGLGVYVLVFAPLDLVLWSMGAYAFINPDILHVLIPCIIISSIGLGLLGTWGRKHMS
jgi:hypothetical protein